MTELLLPGAITDIASGLDAPQARWLVDYYYAIQDYRIQASGQVRAVHQQTDDDRDEFALGEWLAASTEAIEERIRKGLTVYASEHVPGQWAMSIHGVAGVIAAGLLAHIDIEQAPTVGHIWRFAGLDPTNKWLGKDGAAAVIGEFDRTLPVEDLVDHVAARINRDAGSLLRLAVPPGKKQPTRDGLVKALSKRPWNAKLKVLCWKISDSFVKQRGNPKDVYGKVYASRKQQEIERNETGVFSDQASATLEQKRFGKDTVARLWYTGCLTAADAQQIRETDAAAQVALTKKLAGDPGSGVAMLPPGRIDARARRYAVKLFLAHYHHVSYQDRFGEPPPLPYILTQPGHTHFLAPPNWQDGKITLPPKHQANGDGEQ